MVDDNGDLYFLELGANVMTRLRNVSPGGVLRPAAPPVVTTDLRDGSLGASGLRVTDQVDVVVRRGGTQIGSASDVAVSGGSFRIASWTGQAPRPNDVVRITRTGSHALSKIELRVPDLKAALSGGTVVGTAHRGTSPAEPLFGPVTLRSGAATASARIDQFNGSFTIGSAAGAGATVAWTEGTPAAQLRTVAAVDGVPAGGGDTGGNPPAGAPGATPQPGAIANPPADRPATKTDSRPACRTTWLQRQGSAFTVPVLGLTAAKARAMPRPPRLGPQALRRPAAVAHGGRHQPASHQREGHRHRPDPRRPDQRARPARRRLDPRPAAQGTGRRPARVARAPLPGRHPGRLAPHRGHRVALEPPHRALARRPRGGEPVMRRAALAAALALAALAAGCGATGGEDAAPQLRAPSTTEQRTLAAQIQQLVTGVSARSLGYEVRWGAPRAGTRAQADTGRRLVWLYARAGDTPHRVAHDLAHELGHAYDHQRMSEASRREYLQRRGRPDAAWWPERGGHAYTAGAEDFAEVFALCHAASPEFRSRLASRPSAPCDLLPAGAAGDLDRRST